MINEKIQSLAEDLQTKMSGLYESTKRNEYDEAHKQIVAVEEAFKKLKIALCPHPAFASGRCFLCNATYAEAKV